MINTEGFFIGIYENARENSVLILNPKGVILQINQSFMTAFGYKPKDVIGKHFRMLFTKKDRLLKRPESEVKLANLQGSMSDNNYLLQKDGLAIWVMGETVSVSNTHNEKYLVKIVHNIHAQKQLERFLLQSNEFIDVIFNSIKDTGLIILDSTLRIVRNNKAFMKIFELRSTPKQGSKISEVKHSFCQSTKFKTELLNALVKNKPMNNQVFIIQSKKGNEISITITSKLMDGGEKEKQLLLVISMG